MKYHTFISYNSKNLSEARQINAYLSNSGFRVFFDKKDIKPGDHFQKILENALRASGSVLVLIGENNIGPWQEQETYMFQILERAHESGKKIIPLLIGSKGFDSNNAEVPLFLNQYHGIDLGANLSDPEKLFEVMDALPWSSFAVGEYERPLLEFEQERLLRDSVQFYNENAEHYFERWRNDLPLGALGAFLQNVNRKGRNNLVLDAGCGPGHHARYISDAGNKVVGMDLSEQFIKIAKAQNHPNCEFINSDMRVLHERYKEKNQFDAIWACGSLVHIAKEGLDHQLNEFLAFLKPGGILGASFQVDAPAIVQEDGRFFERYHRDSIIDRVESHGYEVININRDVNTKSTTANNMKVKQWYNVVAKAPSIKSNLIFLNRKKLG